jgi:hypothetical protein
LTYLAIFSIVVVGSLVDFYVCDSSISLIRMRFLYHCASLGLLALGPIIQSLTLRPSVAHELATAFGRMAVRNALAAVFYLLQPLERAHLAHGWTKVEIA